MLIDRLVAECGSVKQLLHLARKRIASGSYRPDCGEITRIRRIVAGNRSIGECETAATERAERRVELFVHAGQRKEMLLPLPQAVRPRALLEIFDENAAVVD